MTRRFISRAQAADLLHLSQRTLANWTSRGRGPRVYNPTGRKALYDEAEVMDYILGVKPPPAKPRRGRPPKYAVLTV